MAKHALGRPASSTRPLVFAVLPTGTAHAATPTRRRSVSALLVGATALGGTALLPGLAAAAPVIDPHCTSSGTTTTCTYGAADGDVDFVAPTGVSTFTVSATGGAGGAGGFFPSSQTPAGTPGGAGTTLAGQVTVGANRTYELVVGARGTNGGFNVSPTSAAGGHGGGDGGTGGNGVANYSQGGGGGGASSITQGNGSSVVLVAAGGGGGGGGARATSGAGIPGGAPTGTGGGAGSDGGDGGNGTGNFSGGGGGGGGGLVGGTGGAGGVGNNAIGTGGAAGTSSSFGTASAGATGADGSIVITYVTPVAPTPTSQEADLVTTVDAPASLAVGETGEIAVTVRNDGGVAARGVKTRVSIPSGLRITGGDATRPTRTTLAPGAAVTYVYEVVATKERPRIPITAVAISRTLEADYRDNADTGYVTVDTDTDTDTDVPM